MMLKTWISACTFNPEYDFLKEELELVEWIPKYQNYKKAAKIAKRSTKKFF